MSIVYTFNRKALAAALQTLAKVCPKRHPKPVLAHALVLPAPSGNGARIVATDLERALSVDLPAMVDHRDPLPPVQYAPEAGADTRDAAGRQIQGAFTIPLADVLATVKRLKCQNVELRAGRLEHDAGSVTLDACNPIEFPPAPLPPTGGRSLHPEFFAQGVKRVLHATAKDNGRYAFNAVRLESMPADWRLVATDGRRMALATLLMAPTDPLPKGADAWTALIPASALALLPILTKGADALTIAARFEEPGPDHARPDTAPDSTPTRAEARGVSFIAGPWTLSVQCLDAAFPEYLDVAPKPDATPCRIDTAAGVLLDALASISPSVDDVNKGVYLDVRARDDVRPGKPALAIRYRYGATRSNVTPIAVTIPQDSGAIAFNPEFLTDALDAVKDAPQVSLSFGANHRPGRIDAPNYCAVVMPVNSEPAAQRSKRLEQRRQARTARGDRQAKRADTPATPAPEPTITPATPDPVPSPTAPTKARFLAVYRSLILERFQWAQDADRLERFMASVRGTLTSERTTWDWNAQATRDAWKRIGLKGVVGLIRLRALPDGDLEPARPDTAPDSTPIDAPEPIDWVGVETPEPCPPTHILAFISPDDVAKILGEPIDPEDAGSLHNNGSAPVLAWSVMDNATDTALHVWSVDASERDRVFYLHADTSDALALAGRAFGADRLHVGPDMTLYRHAMDAARGQDFMAEWTSHPVWQDAVAAARRVLGRPETAPVLDRPSTEAPTAAPTPEPVAIDTATPDPTQRQIHTPAPDAPAPSEPDIDRAAYDRYAPMLDVLRPGPALQALARSMRDYVTAHARPLPPFPELSDKSPYRRSDPLASMLTELFYRIGWTNGQAKTRYLPQTGDVTAYKRDLMKQLADRVRALAVAA